MIYFYKKLCTLYKRLFWSKERQARSVGVTLGNNNFIDSRFWSSEPYLITIGNNCQITSGVKFFTHGGGQVIRDKLPDFDSFGKIVIGDFVYLGTNVLVLPGVTIGDNVLVAAGSVVTKSIPSNCVVAGNPVKFICSIDEYLEKNLKYNTRTKGLDYSSKKEFLEKADDSIFISKPILKNR